jgi:hypothetical protein
MISRRTFNVMAASGAVSTMTSQFSSAEDMTNGPSFSVLVYVAARAPDADEDFGALAAKLPRPPASAEVVKANGYVWLGEEGSLKDFAGDLPPARARALYAVQGRGADALVTARTTKAAWRVKSTFYQVSTEDRTINPELYTNLKGGPNMDIPSLSDKPTVGNRDLPFANFPAKAPDTATAGQLSSSGPGFGIFGTTFRPVGEQS